MPVVRISDAAFSDLKHIATWMNLTTPAETLERLVEVELQRLGLEPENALHEIDENDGVLSFTKTPGLSFTRILSASVNRKKLAKVSWAGLLLATIGEVHEKGISGQNLVEHLQVPARLGRYEKEGYSFQPDLGVSIQGQSATDAWREVERLAVKHNLNVELEIQWRDSKKAAYPNRKGKLKAGS